MLRKESTLLFYGRAPYLAIALMKGGGRGPLPNSRVGGESFQSSIIRSRHREVTELIGLKAALSEKDRKIVTCEAKLSSKIALFSIIGMDGYYVRNMHAL